MLSEQEAWQEVNSSTDTDMLSLVQSPAATAPAASADIAAVKIVSFVVVVMHQLLPRLKLHVQHKPVSPQVLQDLTTLVSMVHELTGQVCRYAADNRKADLAHGVTEMTCLVSCYLLAGVILSAGQQQGSQFTPARAHHLFDDDDWH